MGDTVCFHVLVAGDNQSSAAAHDFDDAGQELSHCIQILLIGSQAPKVDTPPHIPPTPPLLRHVGIGGG